MSNFKAKQTINTSDFLYRSLLRFLSKASVGTLSNAICKTFVKLLRTQEAALFLKEPRGYKIRGAYSLRKKKVQTTVLGLKSPFVERLKQIKKSVIFKKQGDFSLEEFKIFYLKRALSRLAVDYIIPLRHKKKFIGFLILGKAYKESINVDPEVHIKEKINLIRHLTKQAAFSLEYALLRERLLQSQNKLKLASQIKDYLWSRSGQGIIFIDYNSERITAVNQKLRKMFKIQGWSPLNKKVDYLIDKYPTSALADFLRVYKDAKLLRRSFRKRLFDHQAIKIKGQGFILNSGFIKGARKNMAGDLVLVRNGV
jgi:transcriptional regulator with GAF, ATPase, and Fis domain